MGLYTEGLDSSRGGLEWNWSFPGEIWGIMVLRRMTMASTMYFLDEIAACVDICL